MKNTFRFSAIISFWPNTHTHTLTQIPVLIHESERKLNRKKKKKKKINQKHNKNTEKKTTAARVRRVWASRERNYEYFDFVCVACAFMCVFWRQLQRTTEVNWIYSISFERDLKKKKKKEKYFIISHRCPITPRSILSCGIDKSSKVWNSAHTRA